MNDDKLWYEKANLWIGIVAGICTILVFVITLCTRTDNTSETRNDITKDDVNIHDNVQVTGDNNITINGNISGDINLNTNGTSETNTSSESSTTEEEIIDQFNFGQAMQHIYSNEKAIQNEIINDEENKPINSSIYPGVSYWYISDKVRLIVVSNGFRDNECSRTYYFDQDGNLTFALMKDDMGEHRLYFYNDILIRYIDENGQNHDINQDLNNYECQWTELGFDESYEIFNGIKKTLEEDFLVTATYDTNTPQTSIDGVNVLVEAETSFPADHVTISGISDNSELKPTDMHGGLYKWQFVANFYIKGTYTITVTAYNSDGRSVSDKFTYVY